MGFDHSSYYNLGRYFPDAHQEELQQRNTDSRYTGRNPEEERHEVKENDHKDNDRGQNDDAVFHKICF